MGIKMLHNLSGDMARNGFLFFVFGPMLLGLKLTEKIPFLPISGIPSSSEFDFFSAPSGIAFILLSFMVMFAILGLGVKYKLVNAFGKETPRPARWLKILRIFFAFLSLLATFALFSFILWLLNTIPICFFEVLLMILGVMALLLSPVFIVAVFCRRFADALNSYLKGQFHYLYWAIFLLVSLSGWLTGLSNIIDMGEKGFGAIGWIVYSVGFAWFLVISFIMVNVPSHPGQQVDQTKNSP
jgi:hypothetical protein